jgi:hypothetical protein
MTQRISDPRTIIHAFNQGSRVTLMHCHDTNRLEIVHGVGIRSIMQRMFIRARNFFRGLNCFRRTNRRARTSADLIDEFADDFLSDEHDHEHNHLLEFSSVIDHFFQEHVAHNHHDIREKIRDKIKQRVLARFEDYDYLVLDLEHWSIDVDFHEHIITFYSPQKLENIRGSEKRVTKVDANGELEYEYLGALCSDVSERSKFEVQCLDLDVFAKSMLMEYRLKPNLKPQEFTILQEKFDLSDESVLSESNYDFIYNAPTLISLYNKSYDHIKSSMDLTAAQKFEELCHFKNNLELSLKDYQKIIDHAELQLHFESSFNEALAKIEPRYSQAFGQNLSPSVWLKSDGVDLEAYRLKLEEGVKQYQYSAILHQRLSLLQQRYVGDSDVVCNEIENECNPLLSGFYSKAQYINQVETKCMLSLLYNTFNLRCNELRSILTYDASCLRDIQIYHNFCSKFNPKLELKKGSTLSNYKKALVLGVKEILFTKELEAQEALLSKLVTSEQLTQFKKEFNIDKHLPNSLDCYRQEISLYQQKMVATKAAPELEKKSQQALLEKKQLIFFEAQSLFLQTCQDHTDFVIECDKFNKEYHPSKARFASLNDYKEAMHRRIQQTLAYCH